jgi:glycosyltransferase involved in cell wall biosynthesis
MKILMISDVYFPRINGVSSSIQTFRHELQQLGHGVVLIAPHYAIAEDGERSTKIMESEEDIIRLPSRKIEFDPEDRIMKIRDILLNWRKIKAKNFDLIHVQTPFIAQILGVRLKRRLKIPLIISYHTLFEEYLQHYFPFMPQRPLRLFTRYLARRHCQRAQGIIVPSQMIAKVLQRYGVRKPLKVLPTGIDLNRFSRRDPMIFRQKHQIDSQRPLLAFVGRVAFEKNIDFLLYVVKLLTRSFPNILLAIAGQGPAEMHLRRLTAHLEIEAHVLFLGYLDRENGVQELCSAADAFVFASRTETQGLVLLEALAVGTPVVALSVMGTKDILQENSGALVPEDNHADFAEKVKTLLSDSNLKNKLREEANVYIQRWSSRALAEQLQLFYEEIVASRNKRRFFG